MVSPPTFGYRYNPLFDADPERKGNLQDVLTRSPGQQTVVNVLATPAKALMETRQIADAIHKGVDTFMEAAPPLIRALDEVAKIHPFISRTSPFFWDQCPIPNGDPSHKVVVLTFKAVYTLEMKRRENDKKVLALYVEYVSSNLNLPPLSHISE